MLSSCDHAVNPRAGNAESSRFTAFGELAQNVADELENISFPIHYPGGARLFSEGEPVRGLFILRSGRAKLVLYSGCGKAVILKITKPGDVLGLSATLTGGHYELTAETLGLCQLDFIKREPFLRFMNNHIEVCLGVAQQLTSIYGSACDEIRCLALSHSSKEKLAKLLLDWPRSNGDTASRITFGFRHEEVAQMIGSSRETVSRLLVEFKRKKLAELSGATLYIRDRQLLQLVADGKTLRAVRGSLTAGKSHRLARQQVGAGDSASQFHPDGV